MNNSAAARKTRAIRWFCAVALCCALAFVSALFFPATAVARTYYMTQVDIDATVLADGTVVVLETRTFDFEGEYNGVYFYLPISTLEGTTITPELGGVGEQRGDSVAELVQNNSEDSGTYQVFEEDGRLEVKIFSHHKNEDATFTIAYALPSLAMRWDDVGELYWKFVSDGWETNSHNVTCTVHLPVPSGESFTLGERVRAWAHGPLDGEISASGQDIVFAVPDVGTSEFAEARITFPAEWLSEATGTNVKSDTRLDVVLAEEEQWASDANAKRGSLRVVNGAMVGLPAVGLLGAIVLVIRRLFKQGATGSVFEGEYFRDVPTEDHPAVLGTLAEGADLPGGNQLLASIMRLTDNGRMGLERTQRTKERLFLGEKAMDDYILRQLGPVSVPAPEGVSVEAQMANAIDNMTMRFLFEKLAPIAPAPDATDGHAAIYVSEIEEVAKDCSEEYSEAIEAWQKEVEKAYTAAEFLDPGDTLSSTLNVYGWVMFVAAFALACLLVFFDLNLVACLSGIALCAVAGLLCMLVGRKVSGYTLKGRDTRAKLKALRHWLKEFTHLDEALPTDVVLWDRLLVMAVALGVADEVSKQLKKLPGSVAEMIEGCPAYMWYGTSTWRRSPMYYVGNSIPGASAAGSTSFGGGSFSSGSGAGGGFSSGGGGGYGGGGGGGAF